MKKSKALSWVAQEKTSAKVYITRVFNYGTWEEWQNLKKSYSAHDIQEAIMHPLKGQWTRRAKAFAETIYDCHIPQEALISYDAPPSS